MEDAVANFTNSGGTKKAASYKGRGLSPTKLEKQTMPRANAKGNDYTLHSPTWLTTVSNHMNRCRCLADYLAIIARGKVEGPKKEDIMKKCNDCKAKIIKFLDATVPKTGLSVRVLKESVSDLAFFGVTFFSARGHQPSPPPRPARRGAAAAAGA